MSDKTPAERLRTEIAIQREAIADLPDDDDERGLQAVLDDIEAVLDDRDRLRKALENIAAERVFTFHRNPSRLDVKMAYSGYAKAILDADVPLTLTPTTEH